MRYCLMMLVIGVGLTGCFWDEATNSSPKVPDLTERDLVGCWETRYAKSVYVYECYAQGGGYYSVDSLGDSYSECFGTYSISGHEVSYAYEIKPGVGRKVTAEMHLVRIRDSLCEVNSEGVPYPQCRSRQSFDSASWGLRIWTYFAKPAGWDSLVAPMN